MNTNTNTTVYPELLSVGDFVRFREDSPRFELVGTAWMELPTGPQMVWMFRREGYTGQALVPWMLGNPVLLPG